MGLLDGRPVRPDWNGVFHAWRAGHLQALKPKENGGF